MVDINMKKILITESQEVITSGPVSRVQQRTQNRSCGNCTVLTLINKDVFYFSCTTISFTDHYYF